MTEMAGLVPAILFLEIGYAAFTQPFIASTRATKSDIALSVASGASRCGEWRAPGSSATSTGQ